MKKTSQTKKSKSKSIRKPLFTHHSPKEGDALAVIRDASNGKEYYLSMIDTFMIEKIEYAVMYNYEPDDGNHADPYHSSEMEKNSVDAERASVDLKCAEYMIKHVNEEFPGTVSGACPAGIFVKLENTIEGMVPFSSLNEYFDFDERKLEAKGSRGTVYRIGKKVRVKVASADPLRRTITSLP